MNTINGSVEVQGTVHTVEFERVMNNFTESYLRVIESQFGIGIQSKVVEEVKLKVVKPKVVSKPSPIGTVLNKGFEKLKNPILKTELERCKSVDYDTSKFITIRELGIKSIYELDKRSKGFWNDYFFKGGVYLRKGLNTSRISQKILFDRVIEGLLKKKKLEPIDSSNSEE